MNVLSDKWLRLKLAASCSAKNSDAQGGGNQPAPLLGCLLQAKLERMWLITSPLKECSDETLFANDHRAAALTYNSSTNLQERPLTSIQLD
jgi:hypothetical protein